MPSIQEKYETTRCQIKGLMDQMRDKNKRVFDHQLDVRDLKLEIAELIGHCDFVTITFETESVSKRMVFRSNGDVGKIKKLILNLLG